MEPNGAIVIDAVLAILLLLLTAAVKDKTTKRFCLILALVFILLLIGHLTGIVPSLHA